MFIYNLCPIIFHIILRIPTLVLSHILTSFRMNVNANNIVFWLLIRICSSPETLTRVRNEITPFIKIVSRKSSEGVNCEIDIDGITKSCPFFKAAQYEVLRLDVAAASMKTCTADITIEESTADAFGAVPQSYVIKKGEWVHVNHNLHQTDARYFPEPELFRPERFYVKDEAEGRMVANQGSIRPFGGGHNLCKGYKFAEREIMIIVAGILSMWDLSPVGGEWEMPGHKRGSGAYLPSSDFRVRLTRRN